jgi:hypothetical protein
LSERTVSDVAAFVFFGLVGIGLAERRLAEIRELEPPWNSVRVRIDINVDYDVGLFDVLVHPIDPSVNNSQRGAIVGAFPSRA